MTVWIKKHNNEIAEDFVFSAYMGFSSLGRKIGFFSEVEGIDYQSGDIVVGGVQDSRYVMGRLGVELPTMYIPEGLEGFAGRKVWKSCIGEVLERKSKGDRFFIKPVLTKGFPAQVVDSMPLMTYFGQVLDEGVECWVSDIVNFESEYRVFIIEGEVVGCQYYLGDFTKYLDFGVVYSAMSSIEGFSPSGWCLDFGVDDRGRTLLIEANDGYSIGDYGLYSSIYVKLLEKRWRELSGWKSY